MVEKTLSYSQFSTNFFPFSCIQSMEKSAVVELYERSIEKNKIRYDPFIGDGDSSAYNEVCKMQVYGPTKIPGKEEDIGHVTKRMGNHLRAVVRDHKGIKH